MSIQSVSLQGTTDASGDLTVNAAARISGFLERVDWIDGDLADGNDAVISVQGTPNGVAQTLMTLTNANADAVYYPRTLMQGDTGADLTGSAGGDRTRYLVIGVPRLVVAAGGNAKSGGCILYYEPV